MEQKKSSYKLQLKPFLHFGVNDNHKLQYIQIQAFDFIGFIRQKLFEVYFRFQFVFRKCIISIVVK